jgi:predicted metal-dependent hydrolase
MSDLPPYTVRVSSRARKVSLVVSLAGGLQVVVPQRFDLRQVADIVSRKVAWIQRALARVRAPQTRDATKMNVAQLPCEIDLRAANATWRVDYRRISGQAEAGGARPPGAARCVRMTETEGGQLVVSGDTRDVELCRAGLRRWLSRQARVALGAWLVELSREVGLSFVRLTIRNQRSRWGSCSSRGTISLNCKLLFLPRPLVRYVLLHELCHTQQHNHSKAFWALMAEKEPGYRRLRAELRTAGRYVPGWAQQ